MEEQNPIPHYPALRAMAQHERMKNSYAFNMNMFLHYECLYHAARQGWNWVRTYMLWQRMNHYRSMAETCKLRQLITDVNKMHHVAIVLP